MKKQFNPQVDGSGGATLPHLVNALMANTGIATSRAKPHAPVSSPVPSHYIRLNTVLHMVPCSASTVWRKVRDGSFPRPVKLSARITAWNRDAVEAWLAGREAS